MLLLADWVHNLSPFALRISGDFGIRWYGLAYLLGFLIAWIILKKLATKNQLRVPADHITDLMLWLVLGVIVGGRLGYVLIYQPALLVSFAPDFPFWGALRLNQGGMASHGGLVGVIAAAFLFARKHNTSGLHILDALALVAPIGLMLGRIANFINGELLGRIVAQRNEPAPWWAVRYPQELIERAKQLPPLDPAQTAHLEELIVRADAALAGVPDGPFGPAADQRVLQTLSDPTIDLLPGYPLLIEAIQQGHTRLATELAPLLHARHPSQLYQALCEGPLVLAAVWSCWLLGHRKPGQTGAVFLISYGIGRIATEFFRLPDAHLQTARILGLSRGQWLSAAMILAGILILTWATRAKQTHPTLEQPPPPTPPQRESGGSSPGATG